MSMMIMFDGFDDGVDDDIILIIHTHNPWRVMVLMMIMV